MKKVSEMTAFELLKILTDELEPEWSFAYMSRDDISRAERMLPEEMRAEYVQRLGEAVNPSFGEKDSLMEHIFALVTATPRQRAEALVQTLGGGE